MNRFTLWFDDPATANQFTEDRTKNQLFLFFIHTMFNVLYFSYVTYNAFLNDNEPRKDETSADWFCYAVCELLIILYALVSFRFRALRQYLMVVFFFLKCVEYTGNGAFERADYAGCRQFVFEMFIWYYCVC